MKLLKSWDLKQHIHLKENERLFLVQLMQLYVFCWGKFTATLLLSRRVVSHKDFQMPCVKFLISPAILKYIITQMQTSFKKCLSLKHVWPPSLDFWDLGLFSSPLLSFQARWERAVQQCQGPSADHTDAVSWFDSQKPHSLFKAGRADSNTLGCTHSERHSVREKPGSAKQQHFTCWKSGKGGAEMLPQHCSEQPWRWKHLGETQKCTGHAWPGFGSMGATGVAAGRRCQQVPHVQQCQCQPAVRWTLPWPRLGQAEMVATPLW